MRIQRKAGISRMVATLLLGSVLLAASGCNNPSHTSIGENNPNANGGNKGVKTQNYSDDGYLGTTSSYPGIPGHRMTLNYPAEAAFMRDSIRDVRGVAGANITFQGADAFVTVRLHPAVTSVEVPTVEREVASVLRFNFPRYTIHVTSLH
ncbi:MAG: hypothetical protein JWR03_1456 [Cohnella sp.]|nr:hypothetical protein [Cohnella sp.]